MASKPAEELISITHFSTLLLLHLIVQQTAITLQKQQTKFDKCRQP